METLIALERAREQAYETKIATECVIGPAQIKVYVQPHGRKGGYAFVLHQGPADPVICIKNNASRNEWNFFVDMGAACCLTTPALELVGLAKRTLLGIGAHLVAVHVNRIDIAFDVGTDSFDLNAQSFITPARMKARAMKPEHKAELVGVETATVCSGNYQSVTAGLMPSRQVITYDKLREIQDRGKLFWHKVWKRNGEHDWRQVWRVEVRAGRDALSRLVPVKTTDAVFALLPNYLSDSLQKIRYVSDRSSHSNVSRTTTHPLWELVQDSAADVLQSSKPPLLHEDILRAIRERRLKMAVDQSIGNAVSAHTLSGLDQPLDDQVLSGFFKEIIERAVSVQGVDHLVEKQIKTKQRLANILPVRS